MRMAVFFKNDCKFNGCGRAFPTLNNLIEHIEASHIDFDPKVTAELEDRRPSSGVPFSYVLRYSQSQCRQIQETTSADVRMRIFQHASKSLVGRHHNGRQLDDEDSNSDTESSNDSWMPSKETVVLENEFFSFKYSSTSTYAYSTCFRKIGAAGLSYIDKPFACSVPGCKKRYKNINGIKYHYKNGHKNGERSKKILKHTLGKKNKNHGLKFSTKKIPLYEESNMGIYLPSASAHNAAISMPVASKDYPGAEWSEGNNMIVPDQVVSAAAEEDDKMEKLLSKLLNSTDSNSHVIEYNQWDAVGSVQKSDLPVMRPVSQMDGISNNVSYFK